MFTQFYNEAIRKLVIGFGSLFNDIRIVKTNPDGVDETIRVPLSYGPKEKFLRRIEESSSISNTSKVQITLPRIGFDITGFAYDSGRKTNKLRKRKVEAGDGLGYSYNYNEVPYLISFGLYVFTRNQNDNLQIIEQILPYFSPEFVVSFNMNSVNKKVDVPIVLNGVSTVDEYEGDLVTRRAIVYTLGFGTRIRYYRGVGKSKQILETEVDFSENVDPTTHKFETLAIDGTTTSDGAGGYKEPYTETINFFDTDV